MPISTQCLEAFTNSCISAGPDCLKTQQLAGIPTAIETAAIGCSVANAASLPSAIENEGRMIFVEDIGAYRFSNGTIWSNDYSTSTRIACRIFSTGDNIAGALGINTSLSISASTPVREFTSSENWCQISAKQLGTQAIKTDGTLWNWGYRYGLSANSGGALINRSSPVQEACSATNWCFSAGGGSSTGQIGGAIKTDGTLWTWGFNRCGDLGVGTATGFTTFVTPIQEASSSTDWCNFSIFWHACPGAIALKTNGTLWGWGQNICGSIAVNNVDMYSSPVQEVSSSTDWSKIAASIFSAAGIKTDGTLWSWGLGRCGNLATNTADCCFSSPVQEISSSTDWSLIFSSRRCGQHAIKTDGTLWSWGLNAGGMLGNSSIVNSSSPVQEISSSTNWCIVGPGQTFSMGIKTDSTLWGWGNNTCGVFGSDQIPIGSAFSSPVQVSEITDWNSLSLGECHAAFILAKQIGFNEP